MELKELMRKVAARLAYSGGTGIFLGYSAALALVMSAAALAAFFFNVRGAEQTMVPHVVGKDIIEALVEMQQKELYPQVQLRFSRSAEDRNRILEQDPRAGTIVKAGRRIRLVVSQGAQISRIENYVGRSLDEVRSEARTYNGGSAAALFTIQEPVLYENSVKPMGTILNQSPAPGTSIAGPTAMRFVVSRGSAREVFAPVLLGLTVPQALEESRQAGVPVRFSIRTARTREAAETVVSQNPAGGVPMAEGRVVEAVVAAPAERALAKGEVFRLFSRELALSPFPVRVGLEAVLPGDLRVVLAEADHSGGVFTVPYRLPIGSELVLLSQGIEIYREVVR